MGIPIIFIMKRLSMNFIHVNPWKMQYVTAHEKTDHSPQYEAIKLEEWPYLEIQFIPSMESTFT